MKTFDLQTSPLGLCTAIVFLSCLLVGCAGDSAPSGQPQPPQVGCAIDADCGADQRCLQGGCIPAKCANGVVDANEECDDGNLADADGCNVKCELEPSGVLPDDEPSESDANLPVAMTECGDEIITGAYAPGEPFYVRVCARTYVGIGVTETAIRNDLMVAQRYFNTSGTNIKLVLPRVEVVPGGPNETDPAGQMQLDALKTSLRTIFDSNFPGGCDVVLGYTNTLRNDTQQLGGQASWPSAGIHVALVARGNMIAGTGHTTAHELGHVFGLFHTFETPDDKCSDTGPDPNCANEINYGCDATCNGLIPPAHNTMSYYFCEVPLSDSFSACQTGRSRCFISKMFTNYKTQPSLNGCGDALKCITDTCNGDLGCLESTCRPQTHLESWDLVGNYVGCLGLACSHACNECACSFVEWGCDAACFTCSDLQCSTQGNACLTDPNNNQLYSPAPSQFANCGQAICCIAECPAGDQNCIDRCQYYTKPASWTLAVNYVACLAINCTDECQQGNAACDACSNQFCSAQGQACGTDPYP